jgi:hypothetical protein
MYNFEERVISKLDALEEGQKSIELTLAALPHTYVPREELDSLHDDARTAKRWAIGIGVPTLLTVVGLLINVL